MRDAPVGQAAADARADRSACCISAAQVPKPADAAPKHLPKDASSQQDGLAGATGFEPVAFGFGVGSTCLYNPHRNTPTLLESHGWRAGWIARDPVSPTGSQGFCYPVA